MRSSWWILGLIFLSCGREPSATERAAEPAVPSSATAVSPLAKPYKNTVLILGGRPSVNPDLPTEQLYSSLLKASLDDARILNAALPMETFAHTKERLSILLQHDLQLLLIELGADAKQQGLSPDALFQNTEALLEAVFLEHPKLNCLLILSDSDGTYRAGVRQLAEAYPSVQLLDLANRSPYSTEWHQLVATSVLKLNI